MFALLLLEEVLSMSDRLSGWAKKQESIFRNRTLTENVLIGVISY